VRRQGSRWAAGGTIDKSFVIASLTSDLAFAEETFREEQDELTPSVSLQLRQHSARTMNKNQLDAFYPMALAVPRLFHKLAHGVAALHRDSDVTIGMRAVLESVIDGGPQTVPHMARVRPVATFEGAEWQAAVRRGVEEDKS
jgi:hypothetical protein